MEPSTNWYSVATDPPVAPRNSVTSLAVHLASWRRTITPFVAWDQAWQPRSPGVSRQWGQLRMWSKSYRTGTAWRWARVLLPGW